LTKLQAAAGDKFLRGVLLHDHDRITPIDQNIHAAPISALWAE
jgi:AbrB family looped-hinge helix DNA binding protein